MCLRNYVSYSCPESHTLLDNITPFVLCKNAQHHPIPVLCAYIVDYEKQSEELCLEYLMREHRKTGLKVKQDWNETWPGGSRWTGYRGVGGRDIWKDEFAQ